MNVIGKDVFMDKTLRRQAGFGLIEVLIAAVVVAVGLLSVAALQSRLAAQSSDSKARAEAIALAQGRIENLRNYTNEIDSRQEFDATFAATAGFGNDTTFAGVNATFTRSEAVGNAGTAKDVVVRVTWTDSDAVNRDVSMAARLAYESPRAAGDIARSTSPTKISGPTGRARVGEGLVPYDVSLGPTAEDGTAIWNDGTGDLKLVVDGRVVLTLMDACRIDELDDDTCLNFVTIDGRVYIDRNTQNNLSPGEVHVIASDASYCQRYYVDDGSTVVVNNGTSSTLTTPNGDYEYFDYRCYVGGGWYGNIGILLSDGMKQSDKVCQGDPTVDDETWKRPSMAARRAYRGMIYRRDDTTDSGWAEDANGDPVLFSAGVRDGAAFPDPSYAEWVPGASYFEGDIVAYDGYAYRTDVEHEGITLNPREDSGAGMRWIAIGAHGTHDFVIASLATSHTAGSDCIDDGVIVRSDATVGGEPGGLFAGMPNDFVCLNPDHVDSFSADYSAPIRCPYPPTNGPAKKHTLQGVITVSSTTELAESISVQTSDGGDACTRSPFVASGSTLVSTYTCDVYEWGDGWTGFVTIRPNSFEVLCVDDDGDEARDDRRDIAGITGDATGYEFHCDAGSWSLITGTVKTTDLNSTLGSGQVSSTGGWCTVARDGLSYACTTGIFSGAWLGTITFTTTSGLLCGPGMDGSTVSFTNVAPGRLEHDVAIKRKSNQACPL